MKTVKKPKILAIASGGGHWIQLLAKPITTQRFISEGHFLRVPPPGRFWSKLLENRAFILTPRIFLLKFANS